MEGGHWFNGAEDWELHSRQSISFFLLVGREKRGKDGFCFRRNIDIRFKFYLVFIIGVGLGGRNAFCNYLFRGGMRL